MANITPTGGRSRKSSCGKSKSSKARGVGRPKSGKSCDRDLRMVSHPQNNTLLKNKATPKAKATVSHGRRPVKGSSAGKKTSSCPTVQPSVQED